MAGELIDSGSNAPGVARSRFRPWSLGAGLLILAVGLFVAHQLQRDQAEIAAQWLSTELLFEKGLDLFDTTPAAGPLKPGGNWIVEPDVHLEFLNSQSLLSQVVRRSSVNNQPQFQQADDAGLFLRRHLKVTCPRLNVVRIEFTSGTPAERAEVANSFADVLMREFYQQSTVKRGMLLKALDDALTDTRAKLHEARHRYYRFDQRHQEGSRVLGDEVDEPLRRQLPKRQAKLMLERVALDARLAVAAEAEDGGPGVDPDLSTARKVLDLELAQLEKLKLETAESARNAADSNLELDDLRDKIRELRETQHTLRTKRSLAGLTLANAPVTIRILHRATPGK